MLVALFLWSYWKTYDPAYQRIPQEAWSSPKEVAAVHQLLNALDSLQKLPQASQDSILGIHRPSSLPPVPLQVLEAGDRWVAEVNKQSPQTILLHRTDAQGNLYLVLGGWWQMITPDNQVIVLNGMGTDAFGSWDTQGPFAPGIVIVDRAGRVADNIDKKIHIYRLPVN